MVLTVSTTVTEFTVLVARLAAIEAIGDALVLSTMRFEDELANLDDYSFPAAKGVQKRDLQMAQRLIKEFSSEWDPGKYTDDYRDNIKKVIAAKQKDTEADLELEGDPQSAQVVDLMERLRKSLGTKRADTAKVRKARRARKAAGKSKAAKRRRRAA
jgi:DNA end-binding protein Ku